MVVAGVAIVVYGSAVIDVVVVAIDDLVVAGVVFVVVIADAVAADTIHVSAYLAVDWKTILRVLHRK